MKTSLLSPPLALSMCCSLALAAPAEHQEFDATLLAPYQADTARTFTLNFSYPGLARPGTVDWRVELLAPDGWVVLRWRGQLVLAGDEVAVPVPWSGRLGARAAPAGIYRVRLRATLRGHDHDHDHDRVEQDWEIAVGPPPAPRMPPFSPLPRAGMASAAPAPGALPYTVYLGNLHSQTNHSDGGADVDACKGAQAPGKAPHGPRAAFAYARARGLDILVASEHNHMVGLARFHEGLDIARDFSQRHPGFLALYGQEWGVIENGGHVNIFNSDALLGWERDADGRPLADVLTPRGDYAALYALMRERGWIGQFNHPAPTGQFMVDGVPLAYTEDGGEAMVLCEVMNSSAFSTNTSETETRRSNFEGACNRLLEAGYRLAFSTNQDNHCANWGAAYTNRTGVLLPNGVPLDRAGLVEALRARRVFATMDKDAQLVLTANGRMMGERFVNRGPLTLVAHFASQSGRRAASVAIMEGVPGRKSMVTRLSSQAETTFTLAPGAHFYYAKLTQDDGNVLWSAPVWVTQED